MDKQLVEQVLSIGHVDADGRRYIKDECTRDHRTFEVILSLPLDRLGDSAAEWETACEIRHEPPYDQDTFEAMIWDFCADHYTDEDDRAVEWPEVDPETIEYDEIKGMWLADARFPSDEHWYTLVGYPDGMVEIYY